MTQIVMMKPEHIRPNMDEQKNDEQTAWVGYLDFKPAASSADKIIESRTIRLGQKRPRILRP